MLDKRAWLALTLIGVGCGQGNGWSDYKETPLIERGACATIVMPGEQVPLGSQPDCPNGYSSLGGSIVYDEKDYERTSKPKQMARAAAGAPAAVVGAPVAAGAAAAQSARNGRQQSSSSASAEDPTLLSEREQIDRMRREIVERERMGRGQSPAPPTRAAPATSPQYAARAPRSGGPSIAEELAALRGERAPEAAPSGNAPDVAAASPTADRVADRDGDGAPDHWIYRDESGRPAREQFDENGDARPDRTAWLDPVTGREARVEEDTNLDGRVDTWIELADGNPARQRRDTNYDGAPDTWAYYDRAGRLSREEHDLDGDGFRDRESLYREGKLAKQREDRDGDGRFDLVTTYDADERIARRDEDRDGDGKIDTRSIYQAGKLVKREVVSEAIDDGDELSQTEW